MFISKRMAIAALRCLWWVAVRDMISSLIPGMELMLNPEMALHFWGGLGWLPLGVIFLQKAWRFLLQPPVPLFLSHAAATWTTSSFLPSSLTKSSLFLPHHTFEKRRTFIWIIVFNNVGKFMYIIYQFWNIGHIGQSVWHESILFQLHCNSCIKGKIHLGLLWIKYI